MADEWACDDCGYITSAEPDAGKCPGCGSKMAKIEGIDDVIKDGDRYDDDDLAPLDEDDDEMVWADLKDIEQKDEEAGGQKTALSND